MNGQSMNTPAILPDQMASMENAINQYQELAFNISDKLSRIYSKPTVQDKISSAEQKPPQHLVDDIGQKINKIQATNDRLRHCMDVLNDCI